MFNSNITPMFIPGVVKRRTNGCLWFCTHRLTFEVIPVTDLFLNFRLRLIITFDLIYTSEVSKHRLDAAALS